ncbi:MFS transporter [Tardisphaera saccharovorans]|nr:MFS transporter [TACK group archaeon]
MMRSQLILAVIFIVLITFAFRASNNMMVTTVPLVAKYDFDLSATEIGLLSSAFSLASFTATLYNSKICVRRRRVYFMGASIAFAILLPLFYLATPITIWLLSVLAGFVMGLLMPNIITSAGLYDDPKIRERVLAVYTLALSTSLVVGPSIEGVMLLKFSLKQVFLLFLPLGVLVALIAPTIRFPQLESRSGIGVKQVTRNPYFWTAVYNNLTYNIPFAMLTSFGGIYAKDFFNASYSQVELLFALFFSTSFSMRLLLSLKHFERLINLTYLSVSLTIAGLFLMVLSPNLAFLALAFLILGFPHGFTYPISLIYIGRGFREELRNAANSLFFSVMTIIGVIVPTVAGIMIDSVGFKLGYLALIAPVAALLFLIWRNVKSLKRAT